MFSVLRRYLADMLFLLGSERRKLPWLLAGFLLVALMDVLGLACLTNYGAGMPESVLTHNNVIEKSNRFSEIFSKLLMGILKD